MQSSLHQFVPRNVARSIYVKIGDLIHCRWIKTPQTEVLASLHVFIAPKCLYHPIALFGTIELPRSPFKRSTALLTRVCTAIGVCAAGQQRIVVAIVIRPHELKLRNHVSHPVKWKISWYEITGLVWIASDIEKREGQSGSHSTAEMISIARSNLQQQIGRASCR